LRGGFAAIKAEKFYLGANFRVNVRKLRATLLDFQLTGNPIDRENFRREAEELKDWLRIRESSFVGSSERAVFQQLEEAYDDFLVKIKPLLPLQGTPPNREAFADKYAQIRLISQPLLRACDEVVQVEHAEFDVFLKDSERALLSLQGLFLFSLVLLVALAVALAVLVYRGMIAPLRAQLDESQALIQRQEKLAALGVLGAGVAHEIRNPLTAIKFRLFSLKKSLPPESADNEDARVIGEEIGRLDHIVKDFLQFARPSEPELVRVPAERILQEVAGLMRPELEPNAIQLKVEAAQPAWVEADTHQIKQVLINLVQNSAESIGSRGVITLGLKQASANLGGKVRPAAILAVADTGQGIPPEVQKRLFDPFFTTKESGTGLGLAIAARIVEKHGGVLRYATELNHGALFEIVLPRLDEHELPDTAR
jgi:signal transduction histidine kinase